MNITTGYLNRLKPELTERDLRIIEQVGRFKLMTAGQIERLFFDEYADPRSGSTVGYSEKSRTRNRQAVLRRLVNHRMLARVGVRRVGGSRRGSADYTYKLDVAGQHIARLTSARPRRPYKEYRPTDPHYLAVAELYVRLRESERGGSLALLHFEAEPYCWRTFAGSTLKPDAFVQVGVERGGQRRKGSFFVEVDRGDEHGPKISTKVPQYVAYWQYEQGSGRVFPQVLLLETEHPRGSRYTEQRLRYLAELVEGAPPLFQVALFEDAVRLLSGQ